MHMPNLIMYPVESVGAGANVLKFSRPEIADGFMASGVIRNGNCGGELMGFQIST